MKQELRIGVEGCSRIEDRERDGQATGLNRQVDNWNPELEARSCDGGRDETECATKCSDQLQHHPAPCWPVAGNAHDQLNQNRAGLAIFIGYRVDRVEGVGWGWQDAR